MELVVESVTKIIVLALITNMCVFAPLTFWDYRFHKKLRRRLGGKE